jgi:hypothetical protein
MTHAAGRSSEASRPSSLTAPQRPTGLRTTVTQLGTRTGNRTRH